MAEFLSFRPLFGAFGIIYEPKCSLWNKQQNQPVPVTYDDDEVFPVHYFDDTAEHRSMVMCWTLRFDDILDADALHTSLVKLLDIGDWRKLGGRLRLNVRYPTVPDAGFVE
jgi:hypothetical protein